MTWHWIALPSSAAVSAYVDFPLAPAISAPPRSQLYVNVVVVGVHGSLAHVSVLPTAGVPLGTGMLGGLKGGGEEGSGSPTRSRLTATELPPPLFVAVT